MLLGFTTFNVIDVFTPASANVAVTVYLSPATYPSFFNFSLPFLISAPATGVLVPSALTLTALQTIFLALLVVPLSSVALIVIV